MLQNQMRNYIQILIFVQVAYEIFSNLSSIPYSSTQCYFLWQALIKRFTIMFTEIGIH